MSAKWILNAVLVGAALAVPVEERQSCAAEWGQCGGMGWGGATCCVSGTTCVFSNPYYSQCLPGTSVSTTMQSTSKAPSSTAKGSSTTAKTSSVSTKPSTTSTKATTTTTKPPSNGGGTTTLEGNPFDGLTMWANAYYKSEVSTLAMPSLSAATASAAAAVANVPSFQWLDSLAHVSLMEESLGDIQTANKAGGNYAGIFVVYDLPDRDCAAAASNGEYTVQDNGVADYFNYIDTIQALVQSYSEVPIIFVIEPDSLANLVTNLGVAECSAAQSAYLQCINYALTTLNAPNVAMYIDAGHAGWLGWSANLPPAAQLFASVYKNANAPSSLRGLATNVANYNAWQISSPPSYTSGDSNYDESLYIHALSPLLEQNGWPNAYFITDQSRSGKQPTGQQAWGDWCNAVGTGFGTRPTSTTGDSLLDAFVWVKPGGECDGTSNSSAPRYDYHCGYADALQPSPQAGDWFQAMFVQLLTNANPPFL